MNDNVNPEQPKERSAVCDNPNHTEQINELAKALASFQGNVPVISKKNTVDFKTKNGQTIKFKYADLADIIKAIQEPLAKQELAVLQTTEYHKGQPYLVTMLAHSSGQWIKSRLHLNVAGGDMKALGTALTYCRRYALSGMLGLATDDDLDALEEKPKQQARKATPKLTKQQIAQANGIIGDNNDLMKRATGHYGANRLEDIPANCFKDLISNLENEVAA